MFSSGWLLGIVFDGYRVISRPFKLNRFTFSILDIVFWLFATVLVFRMLYLSNYGELRLFIFIGLLLGLWFYYQFVSVYTVVVIKWAVAFVQKVGALLWRCLNGVIIKPIKLLYRALLYVLGIFAAMTIFLYQLMIQCLYPFSSLMTWLGKKLTRFKK